MPRSTFGHISFPSDLCLPSRRSLDLSSPPPISPSVRPSVFLPSFPFSPALSLFFLCCSSILPPFGGALCLELAGSLSHSHLLTHRPSVLWLRKDCMQPASTSVLPSSRCHALESPGRARARGGRAKRRKIFAPSSLLPRSFLSSCFQTQRAFFLPPPLFCGAVLSREEEKQKRRRHLARTILN